MKENSLRYKIDGKVLTRTGKVSLFALACVSLLLTGGADAATPSAWVGSGVDATFPNADGCAGARYPSAACSLPSVHHTFYWGMPYVGDLGLDQQNIAKDAAVNLYVAPQNGENISTYVEKVTYACAARSGESASARLARGGRTVVVGVYNGSTRLGWVTYAHINSRVSQGTWIGRWGTTIGTVGTYTSNSCWTGRHLHLELTNQKGYACVNKGWKPGQAMKRTNFVGFIGGSYASGPRQTCP